jgi:hypothetical protein
MFRRKRPLPFHKQYQLRITPKPSRKLNYAIGVLSIVVLVFASSTMVKVLTGETKSLPPIETAYVRVQVLNGCGKKGAAAKAADYLRRAEVPSMELDIVDEDNFESYDVSETMIISREEGALEYAHRLAAAVGARAENVVYQALEDNYLSVDLTVIIGKDFDTTIQKPGSTSR